MFRKNHKNNLLVYLIVFSLYNLSIAKHSVVNTELAKMTLNENYFSNFVNSIQYKILET